jgi:hypothetical protein
MTLLSEFSCPWPVSEAHCDLTELAPETPVFSGALATASAIMTRLSAYSAGLCEAELRPLGLCPSCRTWCCGGADSLSLLGPEGLPVETVVQVRLGADPYDDATWHFDAESKVLYRVPPDVWPRKDEKWSAIGEGEAFVVDTTVGSAPDAWALDVCARLTKELVLSCTGSKCRLPSNVTTVTSQGITVRLRDEEINTFIPELGAWVHAMNPYGARLPAKVFSPEVRGGVGGCRG